MYLQGYISLLAWIIPSANAFTPSAATFQGEVKSSKNKVTLKMLSSTTLKQQQVEDEKISGIVQFPNNLNPFLWNVVDKKKGRMQEEARVARFPKADCADIHQELGIAKNATYEEMIKATSHLMEKAEAEGDYKKKWRFKVERIESYKFN